MHTTSEPYDKIVGCQREGTFPSRTTPSHLPTPVRVNEPLPSPPAGTIRCVAGILFVQRRGFFSEPSCPMRTMAVEQSSLNTEWLAAFRASLKDNSIVLRIDSFAGHSWHCYQWRCCVYEKQTSRRNGLARGRDSLNAAQQIRPIMSSTLPFGPHPRTIQLCCVSTLSQATAGTAVDGAVVCT